MVKLRREVPFYERKRSILSCMEGMMFCYAFFDLCSFFIYTCFYSLGSLELFGIQIRDEELYHFYQSPNYLLISC